MDESEAARIIHLHTVEKLSFRQIALELEINRDAVSKIIRQNDSKIEIKKESILAPYYELIHQWYKDYPSLQAVQVYDRLKSYGFTGSYPLVVLYTQSLRKRKKVMYHSLIFLPGQEGQVDWFVITGLPFGRVYGFIFVLSYSRYAWGNIYPRHSFEFFLAGHIECFKKFGGVPQTCRYDNLKSVVLSRKPQTKYNPHFLDFARFYNFSIYLCNPYSGHEKGRVERAIRTIRALLYGFEPRDIPELNTKYHQILNQRNDKIHRVTGKKPIDMLKGEKLRCLPAMEYQTGRVIPCLISKTGFAEFDTNKYSVPNIYGFKKADIIAYPDKIEIMLGSNKVATHKRSFLKGGKIENPFHREKLLDITPEYKYQRVYELMKNMDPSINYFLTQAQAEGEDELAYAHQLFKILKLCSKSMLISCVKEVCSIKAFKIKTILSKLNLPHEKEQDQVYPKDNTLLDINYEQRRLEDYDELS
jgi:transposase